ncbi:hypothetical protein A9404_10870 [Halothiobacillus diazotrophicus]|uniref:ATPase dynein-related AAA domain-containing protein n=1 Tax=Halothiobacillus diazotrophicus TaxID=1860122 RepID=A0A191ZIV5_9GAMM|nr:MoxR family ATPase [Halothiobacillus diazotrophicus]ANJ67814.1 hypothetical protein A9404_10870 [Halothiobacillus diazotrophicus]
MNSDTGSLSVVPTMDARRLAELLDETVRQPDHAIPVMIWGAPGIGKSDLVRQAAERQGVPLIDLRLSQLEPTDLRGIPLHEAGRVRWVPPEELPDAQRDGMSGVLFLDEINAAPPAVAASAYQLILDRRLGTYHLPAGWTILAAGNRLDDRGITYAMPAPLANRFMHVTLTPDVEAWLDWAARRDVHDLLRDFLAAEPDWLVRFSPDPEVTAFPSPRSWAFVDRVLKRRPFIDATTFTHVAACVGRAAAEAFADHAGRQTPVADWANAPEILRDLRDLPAQIDAVRRIREAVGQQRIDLGQALVLATELPDDALSFGLIEQLHELAGDRLFDEPAFSVWVARRGATSGFPLREDHDADA